MLLWLLNFGSQGKTMWYNNALIYEYELEDATSLALLAENALKPCAPHTRFSLGWQCVSPGNYTQELAGCTQICMGKEERILPRGVINRFLAEKILAIENEQGRQVRRVERMQLAEDLEFELLPKAFCIEKKLYALFDTMNTQLIINTASEAQASQLITLLCKTVPGLHIYPIALTNSLAPLFTSWLNNPNLLPSHFQLAADCVLFSRQDEKKKVHCKGYELPAEEISTLLLQSLDVAEISLIWNERIQFSLNQDFTLKRIKALDYVVEEMQNHKQLEDEQAEADAELTLLAGELRGLIKDLHHLCKLNQKSPQSETAEAVF
jgi:recombination associated protein RdgC